MSTQYPGGFITKSPVAPTSTAASGIWTVDQALQYVKAGTWPSPPIFIEDLFSTYLYTGNGSTQTITNNINVSGKGGLVWIKSRSNATDHKLTDTARGVTNALISNKTDAQTADTTGLTAFGTTGFTVDTNTSYNASAATYVSWTFAKQSKFFDIVTYTGTGAAGNVSHSLGTTPGFLIIKRVSSIGNWSVFARDGTSSSKYTYSYFNSASGLNLTATAAATNVAAENLGYITSTTFDPNNLSGSGAVGNSDNINDSGVSYVAYLFANDAGGFAANGGGSTNGISCGSYTGTGSPIDVNLGYEAQWVMIKRATGATAEWTIFDNMRGMAVSNNDAWLYANATTAEISNADQCDPTATGFRVTATGTRLNSPGDTYVYVAIRRGPMKVPTSGTSVFAPSTSSGNPTAGFPVDNEILLSQAGGDSFSPYWASRLTGADSLTSSSTAAANANFFPNAWASNTQFLGGVSVGYTSEMFRRAPSFFDVVCYTGTGAITSFTHNLGVAPELMIVKARSTGVDDWVVYVASLGYTRMLYLNGTSADLFSSNWGGANPTSSVFWVGAGGRTNTSGTTYVNYLFATCPGVSKVGSYTGTGATQTISCGFTGGARFVLIRNTNPGGAWYVWDTARGMVAGTDPSLQLNSTAAEANANSVYTTTGGFQIVSTAAGINGSGLNYIFLAIA